MKSLNQNNIAIKRLKSQHFETSKVVPAPVSSAIIASVAGWKIKYVIWKPGTRYKDHELKDDAFLFVTKGSLSVRAWTLRPRTVVHFKKDLFTATTAPRVGPSLS